VSAGATDPTATCARCGGAFHCGANDPQPCACTQIKLDPATLARLRETYQGCLCLRCLAALAAGEPIRPRS
jgi:hypothetical protein